MSSGALLILLFFIGYADYSTVSTVAAWIAWTWIGLDCLLALIKACD